MDFGRRDGEARDSREQHQRERESVHRCCPPLANRAVE